MNWCGGYCFCSALKLQLADQSFWLLLGMHGCVSLLQEGRKHLRMVYWKRDTKGQNISAKSRTGHESKLRNSKGSAELPLALLKFGPLWKENDSFQRDFSGKQCSIAAMNSRQQPLMFLISWNSAALLDNLIEIIDGLNRPCGIAIVVDSRRLFWKPLRIFLSPQIRHYSLSTWLFLSFSLILV